MEKQDNRNQPPIPHREYADAVVSAAIRNWIAQFRSKAENLNSLEIFMSSSFKHSSSQSGTQVVLQ
jgi:hypothetical protein